MTDHVRVGSYGERRARKRAAQEMHRRLEELDRLDAMYGLGAMPGSTVTGRRVGRGSHRERKRRGAFLPGVLITLALTFGLMLLNPGGVGYQMRNLVDRLNGDDENSYAFLQTAGPYSTPVGWSHCEPIRYVVNPRGAPADWEKLVTSAVEETSDASGFDFEYDGKTDDRDFDDRGALTDKGRPAPVLIGWADTSEYPELQGDTAGFAGSSAQRVGGRIHFVTGRVVLDAVDYAGMDRAGQTTDQRLILAHELGHILGLDHVDDREQLMNPTYVGQRGFGSGDKTGLRKLHDLPC